MSTNSTKRFGALAALVFGVALFAGLAPAGAATPAVTNVTLTIDTKVENHGVGTATPDYFTYHVFDNNTSADVADGIFNHSGVTKLSLPPGTYGVTEDPLEPYEEHASSCGNVTISVGHPQTCVIKNIWTPATILVSTEVDNSAVGSATAADFHYKVVDTSNNKTVGSGTFDKSGTTKITEPDGTYTVTEGALNGYDEDATTCANLAIDLADPASCIINNVFNPHDTTTVAPVTTAPAGKQITVHGSVTTTSACVMTLVPALESPSTSNLTVSLAADAYPQPHKGQTITLTNSKLTVTTPASLLQQGVALNIVKNGDLIPEHVTLVIAGDGTVQGTHTYSAELHLKIVVKNSEAQPLVASIDLPNTSWTPDNATDPVFFSEQSMTLATTISSPAIGTVTSTFTCTTPGAPTLIALSAQGGPPPTGPRPPETPSVPGSAGSTGQGTNVLPVTGTSVWLWLAPAVLFIYVGLLALGATSRKRRRTLNS